MHREEIVRVLSMSSLALLLTSCATGPSLPVYKSNAVGMAQTTLRGVITGAREVVIDNSSKGGNTGRVAGSVAGATIGAVAANEGHKLLGAGVGGAVGLLAGHLVGNAVSKKHGFEYQVMADNGQRLTIVQPANVVFYVGDRVYISLPCGNAPGRLTPCNE
ncbi:MAG: hypothetical protein LBR89_00980 [Holosporales bacterium]|nr:hypothetical protein [Holosporales bacterium]